MKILVLSLVLLSLGALAGETATVYRTVDEKGVVSFSDMPPLPGVEAEELTIDFASPQSAQEYQRQLEAMRETTDRMVADRRAREKHRAEMREIAAKAAAAERPAQPGYVENDNGGLYTPVWGYYRYPRVQPPWRPGYRPGPGYPVVPTPYPVVDLRSWAAEHNSQLMRPIFPRNR